MSKSTKFLILAVLALAIPLFWWLRHQAREASEQAWFKIVPPEHTENFAKVQQHWKRKDFDGATQIALGSVRGTPSDDILYSTLSDVYFSRTQLDPARDQTKNDQWVKLAVQYSERALAANPSDIVNVYNLGEGYKTAGMDSQPPARCDYFKKSEGVFEQLANNDLLRRKSGVVEGEKVDLKPYRTKLANELDGLRQMMKHCADSRF